MSRREYHVRLVCAEPGCGKASFYICDTRADERQTRMRLRKRPWRCVRHSQSGVVLSSDEPLKEAVLGSYQTSYGRFFAPLDDDGTFFRVGDDGEPKGGSGFSYGPGFKAFAEDFPPGTRLIVTARIELPGDAA